MNRRDISEWDLWEVSIADVVYVEVLPGWDLGDPIREVRVYERIFKRDIWLCGTRTQ